MCVLKEAKVLFFFSKKDDKGRKNYMKEYKWSCVDVR